MKKMRNRIMGPLAVPALALVLMLSGCAGLAAASDKQAEPTAETKAQEENGKKIKVMASFYPMYDFAAKIGGERAEVTNMVPAGTEPHDWEPAVSDIKNLEEADLFIYSGAGMEHWAEDVLAGLENKKLISVEASKDIVLREGHERGTYDPHVWLNPMNAKVEMEHIRDAFIEADPEHQETYEANYETYAAGLDELDLKFRENLSGLENKDIVVSHEAFGYLCDAYGLNQVGVEGLSPDSEPNPSRMAQVIDFIKERGVRSIFFEELASPKVAEAIAKETGVSVRVLNPLEGLSDEELKAGADYFSVMDDNLEQLKAAWE